VNAWIDWVKTSGAVGQIKGASEELASHAWRRDSPAQRSIHRHLVAGGAMVLAVGVCIGGWAATTKIAGAVIAEGSLVVDSNIKKVQHPSGGVVAELDVREGDRVKEGQLLLRLDKTQSLAELMLLSKSLDELLARQARLEAERDSASDLIVPASLRFRSDDGSNDAARAIAGERNFFHLRSQALTSKKSQLQQQIVQLQEEIKGLEGQTKSKRDELDLIDRELSGVNDLLRKNLVPVSRATALERDKARLDGENSELLGSIAQRRGKISETELAIYQLDQDQQSEVAKDLSEVRTKIIETEEKRTAAEDQFKRTDIRAPQDGVVQHLGIHTIGGVVAQGETIMEIVPDNDALKVEVKVAPHDIDKVWRGQKVMLRFTSFNSRETPQIEGDVSLVSEDPTTEQRTGASYYMVQIAPGPNELSRLGDVKLVPGMPVEAFVETGDRTVLSYLTKPLRDQIMRGFREK
jgi:HlyD family secretion protein